MPQMRVLLAIFLSLIFISCAEQPTEDAEDFSPVVDSPEEPEEEYSAINFSGLSSISHVTSITAQLNWTHVEGATAYLIYEHSGATPTIHRVVAAPASSSLIQDLTPETTYRFSVKLLDQYGLKDNNSSIEEFTTADTLCYMQTVLADAPVVFYRMDESTGTSANDLGSAGVLGDYLGGFLLEQVGGILTEPSLAVEFNGTDGHVDLGNPSELQITGDQTIALWVYPNALGVRQNPYAKAYGGEGTITIEPTGMIHYYYGTSGANAHPYQGFNTGAGRINAGEWSHIAIVRDLTNMQLNWYINGVLANSGAASYAAAVISSNSALIGQGYVNNFNGRINNLAVFDRALEDTEIQEHYDAATVGCP